MSNIYTDIMDAIDTLLAADASTSSYTRDRSVTTDMFTDYPIVNVLYDHEEERPTTISTKVDLDIYFRIECYSNDVTAKSGEAEALDVATNVKAVLRATPNLGTAGVLDSNSIRTDNQIGITEDMLINIVAITFKVFKRVTR